MSGPGSADDGLYLHDDVPTITVNDEVFVTHGAFMAMQKERDDYRRAVAMIHGHLLNPDPDDLMRRIWAACESVGLTFEDARAMAGLMQWARLEARA